MIIFPEINGIIYLTYLDRAQNSIKHCTQCTKISALCTFYNTVLISFGNSAK